MDRGVVRVYLGAAPGVGTTFAMLAEGRRRAERGADVVLAAVDTRGRGRTTELLEGIEQVPPRADGAVDVAAVLARRPRVVLVDDLAARGRDGAEGGRWRDVERLADEGIDVVSTLWVGHIESQRDVVERITGLPQEVAVPDAFLARVEQVELVDMTPEAIRRRLAHGNIVAPDQLDAARLDLYRPGTLAALRQLALLWVASRIDDPLLEYLDVHEIADRWETRERVVVAVTGAPGNDAVLRRAARIARRGNGELIGVHVTVRGGAAETTDDALAGRRELLVRLGGRYHEVVGDDIAAALVQFARAERATQLVMGASKRSRWAELRHGSVVNTITRELRDTDLHIIATPSVDGGALPSTTRHASTGHRLLAGVLVAVGLPLAVTVGLMFDEHTLQAGPILALLAVVALGAATGGRLVGLAAAFAASLLANWYFVPPRHTLRIASAEGAVAFVLFVVVAALVATVGDALGRRTTEAVRARAEAEALARSTATLIGEHDALHGLLAQVRATFGQTAAALMTRGDDGEWQVEAASGEPVPRAPADGDAVDIGERARLVLAGPALRAEDLRLLGAFGAQLATALAGRELHAQAATAELYAEASNLRAAMLQSVSHDLRTPLASIKASVTSLLQRDVAFSESDRRDLLETIDEESDRLDRVVANLLDMSRLQANALEPRHETVDLVDVVAGALASVAAPQARVLVELADDLPPVRADDGLLERAVANLVANALAWAPADEPVRVDARVSGPRVVLRIADRGPGIPADARPSVFQPFQRLGDRSRQAGVGLGLAVAKGFVDAMGGELELDDTPGGGLSVFVSLPKAEP